MRARGIMQTTAMALVVCSISAGTASAQEVVTYPFDGSFEDATFSVENAIVGEGLVVDYVSHVGEMLNRTGEDVGSDVTIFEVYVLVSRCGFCVGFSLGLGA